LQIIYSANANTNLPDAIYSESKVDSLYNIVFSNDISYNKKISEIGNYSCVSLYTEFKEKLFPLYKKLLDESYSNSNKNGIFFCYNSIANLYLGMGDMKNTKKYLDSAEVYSDKVDNLRHVALYYGIRGRYIQRYFPERTPEAVNNYQNSLYYYDKAGGKGKIDEQALILRYLTMDGFQRNDSAYVIKNINKILDLRKSLHSPIVEFCVMEANVSINEMYYNNTSEENFLDSIIYYADRCLELYESGKLSNSFNFIAVEFYTVKAEAMSKKKGVADILVDSLLAIAESKYDVADSVGVSRVYQIKANAFLKRNMIDSAEVMALKAERYLASSGYKNNFYSIAKNNAGLLFEIYSRKGNYKKAIEYDDLWTKRDEEIKANEIKELELQFEVFYKDSELKQLNSDITYHDIIQKMTVVICVLLCLATLFMVLLFRSKRKNLNRVFALIDAEREETKLKLKLKEEQTVKTQLERYEVLSDFYLKEMELIGKTKDLEQLYSDKESLDKQVELFRNKVESFEKTEANVEQTNNDVQNVIIEDVRRLVMRQMPDSGTVYINNLDFLSNTYIDSLCEKSDGNLSVSYLKYCICFAIGLTISDVAECFNIEQSSVHMIRYRLKKRFGLGNDDDLGTFLQKHI
jgi:hypothetical protein